MNILQVFCDMYRRKMFNYVVKKISKVEHKLWETERELCVLEEQQEYLYKHTLNNNWPPEQFLEERILKLEAHKKKLEIKKRNLRVRLLKEANGSYK